MNSVRSWHITRRYNKRFGIRKLGTQNTVIKDIFSIENKSRCQKSLFHDTKFRVAKWMKEKENIRKAAVLIPMCTVSGIPSLLYTLRSQQLASHSGQVSFPGGIHDETDDHMLMTALREAEEEIGLMPSKVDVWGQMTVLPGMDFKVAVTPILAFCGEIDPTTLQANKQEVDELFAVSFERLRDPNLHGYTTYKKGGYQLPVYLGGPHKIWGLTAITTHITLKLVLNNPNLYNLDLNSAKRLLG